MPDWHNFGAGSMWASALSNYFIPKMAVSGQEKKQFLA
jgi:hypothetical protein